jgi:hypothetical protein
MILGYQRNGNSYHPNIGYCRSTRIFLDHKGLTVWILFDGTLEYRRK